MEPPTPTTKKESVEELRRKIDQYERWFRTVKAQVRLLERERQKFAAVVNHADAGFMIAEPDGEVRWVNGVFRQRFAHPDVNPGELLGQPCHRVLCHKIKPCGDCPATSCPAAGEAEHRELRLWIGDRYRHIYATTMAISDAEGTAEQRLVMLQDITDLQVLRQSEEALRASEERFRTIFEKMAAGMVITRSDGSLLQVNPAFCAMLGHTESELLRKRMADLCHPEDLLELEAQSRDMLAGKRRDVEVESRFLRRDGTWTWGHSTAVWQFDDEKKPAYCIHLIVDVDQRKHAQQALEESRKRFENLVHSLNGIVWEADPHTFEFSFVSQRAQQILGYPVEQWLTQKRFWRNHVHPDDVQKAVELRTRATKEKTGHELEYRMVAAEGRSVWLRDAVSLVLENDEVVKLRGVMIDVTERKKTELALKESEEQLRQSQKMESIGRLAGGIAHDFNNLLTAITGYSEFLLSGLGPSHPMHREANEISKAARSAAELTGQLLAFSRQQVLQPKVLDLNEVVADMNQMLRRVIGEDIELVTTLSESLAAAKADPAQIQQVILNLAVNARDAMPEGGRLTIRTRNVDLTPPRVGAEPRRYVCLALSDTGYGMDEHVQAHIFEPFFTTKPQGQGTGLGMATVYGIVTQSGGHIKIRSAPGQGSTFEVYLPWAAPTERQAAPVRDTAATKPSRGTETILLVEDDESVRELASEILTRSGYRVVETANGVEALDLFGANESEFDLIMTDLVMPRMSGRDLARKIFSTRPDVKVLIVSGYADDPAAHPDDVASRPSFLQKPFTPEDLIRKIREILDS